MIIYIFLLLIPLLNSQEKLFYLHTSHQKIPQNIDLTGFRSKPEFYPINWYIQLYLVMKKTARLTK